MRRRGRWIIGGIAVLAIAAALVFYFAFLPGILADDWEAKAREQHDNAAMAFPRVFATFSEFTFGLDPSELNKAKTPEAFVREVRLEAEYAETDFDDLLATVKRARRDLAAVDRKALTDVPDPPLIGGAGKLGDARDIASKERRYLAMGRDFLDRYERLARFTLATVRVSARAATDFAKGFANIPDNPTGVEVIARPLEASAARIERDARAARRMHPPPDLRAQRRISLASLRFAARSLRGFARSVRARDLPAVERWPAEFTRGFRRFTRGDPKRLNRLLYHSSYSRTIKAMNRLADTIQRAHIALDTS